MHLAAVNLAAQAKALLYLVERGGAAAVLARGERRKRQKPLPDPLEIDEVELLLAHILKSHGEQWHNYFEFALFSGLRLSEQIMLKWPKVDSRRGLVRVEAARVRTIEKDTKTHAVRDVELVDRAMRALQRQREHTMLKGA